MPNETSDWLIERLDKTHQRAEFRCGQTPLDDFLRILVSQYEKRNLGRTYVAVRRGEKKVYGYYTLASGTVSAQDLPGDAARHLPRHPIPMILSARLAVDQGAQKKGLGHALIVHALKRCLDLAAVLGVHAVEVDAIDQQAEKFYRKHGFIPLRDNPLHLYLPITTVQEALGGESR
jgi:GNAT superfamily N-acetyltransferase